jgi:hypothetical protein
MVILKPNQLIDKLKIKNYFGGDSTKGEKINLYMNKGMKQIYDKQMFDIMSNIKELWFQTGTITRIKDCRRYVPVHDICSMLGSVLCRVFLLLCYSWPQLIQITVITCKSGFRVIESCYKLSGDGNRCLNVITWNLTQIRIYHPVKLLFDNMCCFSSSLYLDIVVNCSASC